MLCVVCVCVCVVVIFKKQEKMFQMLLGRRRVMISKFAMLLVVILLFSTPNLMASALPATGSCDSVRDVMTSLKLAHTAMVSESPIAGKN